MTAVLTVSLMAGCSTGSEKKKAGAADSTSIQAEGDQTIYGMACDGCNDTIVTFLSMSFNGNYDGGNPDTLNILEASRNHQVFGQIHIGDKLAIIRNEQDSTVADLLIVTEQMIGKWCYKVLPSLKQRADMDGTEAQMIEQLPDSIAELLTIEREYGMNLMDNHVAFPIGMRHNRVTSDEDTHVEYPEVKRYMEWRIYNGNIILSETASDSAGVRHYTAHDTATLVMLTADTMVLRINDEERGFYKKLAE